MILILDKIENRLRFARHRLVNKIWSKYLGFGACRSTHIYCTSDPLEGFQLKTT